MKAMLSGLEIADAVERMRRWRAAHAVPLEQRSWKERLRTWWERDQPRIWIDQFDPAKANPNSYNLRLHRDLRIYARSARPGGHGGTSAGTLLDMKKNNPVLQLTIPDEGLVLHPGLLYLGRTVEHTESFNCVPCIEGRSSVGRLGICVHVTAGFGDVGFCGTWTLEITVVHPVRVYPGVEICQVNYQTISSRHVPYRGYKYQGQQDPLASRLFMELEGDNHAAQSLNGQRHAGNGLP